MKIILLLSSIATLFHYVMSGEDCVKVRNWNLMIPNNTIVMGEGIKDDTWYTHVLWWDGPAGDLTLSYRLEYYYNSWELVSSNTVNVMSQGNEEWHYFAGLVRKALGLNFLCAKIPGKLKVAATLFSREQCQTINFYYKFYQGYNYRLYLDVDDDDGTRILTGQVLLS